MAYGIITGTAIYDIPELALMDQIVDTPYGRVQVFISSNQPESIVFLPRHGINHTTPPHKINYRANLKAMEILGVTKILAAYAVGSIDPEISPLSLLIPHDFIDFTNGRAKTFFENDDDPVVHVDMSEAYSPELRQKLIHFANKLNIPVKPTGIYVCSNGPRLETPAEIRMFRKLGADVVGMTGVPEVVLAKELNIPFAALAFSVNWAAGIEKTVTFQEEGLSSVKNNVLNLFLKTFLDAKEN